MQAWDGNNSAGGTFTKTDKAVKLALTLDCLVRHGLALQCGARAQRMPKGSHVPNAGCLAQRCLRASKAALLALRAEEYALVANAPGRVLAAA